MALSRTLALASAIIASINADYIEVPIYDSQDRPSDFKDGLMSYVDLTRDYSDQPQDQLEQFLLCTSCTISYIFGNPSDFDGYVKSTEMMNFKRDGKMESEVPVQFVSTNL